MATNRSLHSGLAALGVAAIAVTTLGAAPAPAEPQAVSMARVVAAARTASSIPGLKPADIADAYGLSGGISGATVGIVIPYDTPNLESDLATYRSTFGLPDCTTANGCFRKVDQSGGTNYPAVDAGWSLEASLDVQSVSAACPTCNILVVETSNAGMASLGAGVNRAVSLGAAAVSMSWGLRENIDASYYSNLYFTHPGVPMVAATGDYGYPQAYMPATFSNVIAVGGTTLSRTASSAVTPPRAVTATNGSATAAAGITPAAEHAATLKRAKADLAKAQAKARSAAKAVTAAKKAAASQKKLLKAAQAKYKAASKKARHSKRAAIKRALKSAQHSYSARQRTYKKAASLVTKRNRSLSAANKTVRLTISSVAAAQAVVNADARKPAPTTTTPTQAPKPTPVITAPTQTGSTTTVPVVSTTPVSVPTTVPTTVPTVRPTTAPTSTPTTAPTSTPTTPPATSAPIDTAPSPAPTITLTPEPAPSSTPTSTPTPTPTRTNTAPTAGFGYSKSGLTATFSAANSSDPDGSITAYAWDFGDGATASGVSAAHTFAATGSYVVTLTVTDNDGASTSTYATVSVTAPAPAATPSAARNGWVETAWSGAGSGCSTYIDKPAWQTDTACSTRTVADISAVADTNTGLAVFDTAAIAQGYTSDGWLVIGGTSLATPLISGMLVRSGHAANYSDASALYANRSAFWDVTSGSNGSCSGSPVCTAGAGYDAPTGVGTPKSLASF